MLRTPPMSKPIELSCKLALSYREVVLLAILAGFTGLGTAYVLTPTPDTIPVPIVQYSTDERVCEGGQPTAPEGCKWALDCEDE